MKNIFKILICSLLMVSFSCEDSENTIDDVLDYETGAIIRTISVDNYVVNSSDETSSWLATLEIQDGSDDSSLWSHVDVMIEMKDFTPDNGDNTTEPTLLYTWDASDFPDSPVGQPRGDFAAPFGDVKNLFGWTGSEYAPGDLLTIKLYLNLKDGRVFGPESAAGIITGGFFASPFIYNALLTCSPATGDYLVKMYDCFGDGWQTTGAGDNVTEQSQGLEVDIDGTLSNLAMCSQWNPWVGTPACVPTADGFYAETIINIPEGTEVVTWSWINDYYAEIGVEVFGVGEFDSNGEWTGPLLYSSNGGENPTDCSTAGAVVPGLLPISQCAQ